MKAGTLILKDGTMLKGKVFGAPVSAAGEVVFNTGMVGYPETMTDPSYRGQILVLTYPLVGNYGVPSETMRLGLHDHFESDSIHIKGLIVSEYCEQYSHFSAKQSLDRWMRRNNIPGISGIDTRWLTRRLRSHGVMLGAMHIDGTEPFEDPNKRNLVAEVSTSKIITYAPGRKKKVLLLDCGVKNGIIKALVRRGLTVKRLPWDHPLDEPADGIVLSNGPGDPALLTKTIENIKSAMKREIPIFGVCLGNQLLAHAAGGRTYKLPYGHRGQNQPAIDLLTGRCYITSQNHGFAVDTKRLGRGWKPWFVNANDKTNEGIRHTSKPWRSVQFHPEALPGPTDTAYLFDEFVEEL